MPFEITMPQLGLTMEKGTVVEWLVGVGDRIAPGQEILQVETDKAVVGVEARQEGTITEIRVPKGTAVPVGTVLAIGVPPGERLAAAQPERKVVPSPVAEPEPKAVPAAGPAVVAPKDGWQASWKARTTARQAGLDLAGITGSGPGGRIVAGDVAHALAAPAPVPGPAPLAPDRATPLAVRLAEALGLDLAGIAGSGPGGRIGQEDVLAAAAALIRGAAAQAPALPGLPQVARVVPLAGVRRIVSEGMAASAHTTARVTLFREVDAGALAALRDRFEQQGIRVSYNDLLIHIVAVALREHPEANARLGNAREARIEILDRVNVGLAVDTDRGLLVPVVHDAGRLTLPQIAAETARLIQAARAGRSLPDDLTGGTFTVTNLGMLGVEAFTPVIHLPECCILGVGRIVRKPVACGEDSVAIRPMMGLSLAFDHRVIDGAPAARFLDRIAQLIEDPLLLLTLQP